ncbi:MAG: roadblock/LC7 domain-containing protein [Candidatus Lokiarchaeota archaeon]|nr:roadblock/LC7 domain-containing protein [Candidatus Lokiarchaeota archaeon]
MSAKYPPVLKLDDVNEQSSIKIYRMADNDELKPAKSLDSNQILLIIDENNNRMWVWRGKLTKTIHHYRFSQFARKLKLNDQGLKLAKLDYVDEGHEPSDFPNIQHFFKDIAEDMKYESQLPKKLEENYIKILKELLKKTEISTVVISDKEGLPIISMNRETDSSLETTDEVMIAGMIASLLNLSTKTSIIFKNGELDQFIMKSKEGQLYLFEIDEDSLIICNLPLKASLGVSILAINNAIKQIKQVKNA